MSFAVHNHDHSISSPATLICHSNLKQNVWPALANDYITFIGEFLDVKSITLYQSCAVMYLSRNKKTYTWYKKLYDDGIEVSEKRVDYEWGLTIFANVPWPYRYYKYRIADARLQWVNSLKLKGAFVNVPPKFTEEADQLWKALKQSGS